MTTRKGTRKSTTRKTAAAQPAAADESRPEREDAPVRAGGHVLVDGIWKIEGK